MQISSSRDHFDPLAERYLHSPVHRSGPSLPVLVQLAEPARDDFALDVATGAGSMAFALANHVQHVIILSAASQRFHVQPRPSAQVRADILGHANVIEKQFFIFGFLV
jgi:hypothetical protein